MSMSGGLGYGAYRAVLRGTMMLRLSCMMIDALRCAGIAYFLWDDEVLFFTFVPHCLFMSPNTFRSFPVMCFFDRVSEMENLEDLLAAGIQQT